MSTDPRHTIAPAFTGRRRQRKTRWSVRFTDALAKYVIIVGGIGVTIAFATIVVFLVSVVLPLFAPPKVEKAYMLPLPAPAEAMAGRAVAMQMDEDLASVWVLNERGYLNLYRTAGGELVGSQRMGDKDFAAFAFDRGESGTEIAAGYADGTVRLGRIGFSTSFLRKTELPDAADSLQPGHTIVVNRDGRYGVGTLTPGGELRVLWLQAELADAVNVGDAASPVRLVDYIAEDAFEKLVAIRADGRLFYTDITKKRALVGNKVRRSAQSFELPMPKEFAGRTPVALLLGLNGAQAFLAYEDGAVIHFDTKDPQAAAVVEVVDVVDDPAAKVATVRMMAGDVTMIVADTRGRVTGWFPVQHRDGDKVVERLTRVHELRPHEAPVTAISASLRDRQFVTADARGQIVLRHMTADTTQAKVALDKPVAVTLVSMAPKNDAIAALDAEGRLSLYRMDNPCPDASLAQLFLPIHYEGYAAPAFIYQSTAAHEGAEVKISLVPLLFGTLKATFYAMLFAVPIALLAAIYSSEFMQPQVRAVVKPAIELMASLPSVVLGFIGALVLAPWVEQMIPAAMLVFAGVPLGSVLAGFIWQALPPSTARAVPAWAKFALMLLTVAVSLVACYLLGPVAERLLFGGDLRGWLAGRGTATPGWLVLLLPLALVGLTLLFNLWIKPRMEIYRRGTRKQIGWVELARVAAIAAAAVLIAWGLGAAMAAIGLDPRGPLVGSYVQRNSLIVGLMMGFAIIPIIYTVSEDALSSVPASLRSASLGAGATPWQTAVRVVLPVATSGIFSACMIGFGRAAGETMIVLMAAGGTAITDVNLFNGLRALSANIATELPEAERGQTLYRVLFLSGLLLFAITFIVNTAAEVVRARFRKRAYQL